MQQVLRRGLEVFFVFFSTCLGVGLDQRELTAVEPGAPIVGGFERFARHGDITAQVSGSLLISELGCTACHPSQRSNLQPKAGPKLESAGRRLRADWIAAFLADPAATKPGSTMPDVIGHFDASTKPRAVAALVAFIASQRAPLPVLKATGANPVPHEFWNKGNTENGERLFHQIGCVACHQPAKDYEGGIKGSSTIDRLLEELEPEDIAKMGLTHAARSVASIPLPDTRAKYTQQGLAMFLLEPAIVRPAGRMPNMKLGTIEAADIAAYLSVVQRADESYEATATVGDKPQLRLSAPQLEKVQLFAEGQRLFGERGCVQCHSATGAQKRPESKPLLALNPTLERSCISEIPHRQGPHYGLDPIQRQAIMAAIKEEQTGGAQVPLKDDSDARVKFSLMQLNCYACHERGGQGGIAHGRDRFFETAGQVDLGDEGRLPPPLTGVGRKLNAAWLKRVLQGTGDLRPYLQIRMPKFPPANVDPLVPLLAAADTTPPLATDSTSSASSAAAPDQGLAATGRSIFNVGCVQCHPVRGEALPSVVGIDVGHIGARVRQGWFHDFLLNPASLKPRTRMPTFFAEGSISKEHFNGDVEKQIAALWAYLEDIDRQPLPEKIEQVRRQNFELSPAERPIVLRTFMERAGKHAIAVGFPERVHYAFDAETVRLSEVWRGRFLDAQGTWNDRFAPDAVPLSSALATLPRGVEFALLSSSNSAWPQSDSAYPTNNLTPRFMGYRLDKGGVPEIQYQIGDYAIIDRVRPGPPPEDIKNGRLGLVREFTIRLAKADGTPASTEQPGQSARLWFRAAAGARLARPSAVACTTETGLTVLLPEELAKIAIVRQTNNQSMWLAPLPPATETIFQIEYRW